MNFQNRQEFQKLRKSPKCQDIKKSLNIQTCKIAKKSRREAYGNTPRM